MTCSVSLARVIAGPRRPAASVSAGKQGEAAPPLPTDQGRPLLGPTPRRAALAAAISMSTGVLLGQGVQAASWPQQAAQAEDRPFLSLEVVDDMTAIRNYYRTQAEMSMIDSVKVLRASRNVLEKMKALPDDEVGGENRRYFNNMSAGFAGLFRKAGLAAQTVLLEYGDASTQEVADQVLLGLGSMMSITGRQLRMDLSRPGDTGLGWSAETPVEVQANIDTLLALVPADVYETAMTTKSNLRMF